MGASRYGRLSAAALIGALFLSNAAAAHPLLLDTSAMAGFRVLTSEDGATKADDLVIIEYEGAINLAMAENLATIWSAIAAEPRFERVALRLDSPGGTDIAGSEAIATLHQIRERTSLTTIVGEGDTCASMCVALFIQGEQRYASPASSWMFHGATRAASNVPSLSLTDAYFDKFRARAIDATFIDFLFEEKYVTTPGSYWLSGRELFEQSNIVTDLIPNWRPETPRQASAGLIRGGIWAADALV